MMDIDLKRFVENNKYMLNTLKKDFNAKYFYLINASFIIKVEKYFNFYLNTGIVDEFDKKFIIIEEHEILRLNFLGFSEKKLKDKIRLPGLNLNCLDKTLDYIKEKGLLLAKNFYPDSLAIVYVTDDNNFNPFVNFYKNFSINCSDKFSEPEYKIKLTIEKSFIIPNLFLSRNKKKLINKKL